MYQRTYGRHKYFLYISHTTFNKIQKKYLFPAIHKVYTTNQQLIIDNAVEKGDIDLLGDGR